MSYDNFWDYVIDVSPLRLEMAKKCGSDIIIDAQKEDVTRKIKDLTDDFYVRYQEKTAGGCDIAVDCAGLPLTFLQCLEVINPENGTVNVRLKVKNEGKGAFEVKLFYTVFGGA